MCHASKEKRKTTHGKELPNQDKIRTLEEKETNKYLGIFKSDTIKQEEIKENIKKYFRRTRKLHGTKQYSCNLIKGINTWAVLVIR